LYYGSSGCFEAGPNEGTADIECEYQGEYAYCSVTVDNPIYVTSISLSPSSMTLTEIGQIEYVFEVTAYYSDGSSTNRTWESSFSTSNSNVAIMYNGSGIKAIGEGTCVITASFEGFYDYCNVAVVLRPYVFDWDWETLDHIEKYLSFNMKATEWNRLLQKIRDVYNWKGWSLSAYPLTNVSAGQYFYAQSFNEAKNAIGSKNSTAITDKVSGDNVIGQYFITLRDKLNGIV